MTYLATEMLFYLAAAAVIGFVMGWLIWGLGQRRKLQALRSDLTVMVDAEREAHQQTRLSLDQADAQAKVAIQAAKAEAERDAARQAKAAIDRAEAEIANAVERGRAANQDVVDEALKTANAEKAAASEALAREAQSRAQIEELRLLIGAEKLAAESARAELEEARSTMQGSLDAERAAHQQAKTALDDIRSTLAKTLGSAALGLAGDSGQATVPSTGNAGGIDGFKPTQEPKAAFGMMTDIAAAGEALNNPDLDEADIEDREDLSLDLSSPIDVEPDVEMGDNVEPLPSTANDRIELRPQANGQEQTDRPTVFLDQRPDDVDDLQAIDGIDPDVERRLHENGCYHYHQLAGLMPTDIDWLASKIGLSSDRIAAEAWVDQAKKLGQKAESDKGAIFFSSEDRRNAAS
ncbi:MAG: hypothetical protein AAF543_12600 [Pseudomonadota bacterium]